MEKTLSIIKPDAIKRNLTDRINSYFKECGLVITAYKKIRLTKEQVEEFYYIHKEKPFFKSLVDFMTSGAVIVQIIEGDNAIKKSRSIMGDTDPKKAKHGTIRKKFAESIERNIVHGSDSLENAYKEIAFFFKEGTI